eukprot:TRINITY_DN57708_c0_g1_i1.p1 TRINITY_DN57708_c0_g1~~TRINITY_DN57708_c0_g1_i1.p1  ORF type:complete len:301 (+),score=89.92 TRINITY_DN57708_c0_g1_i1:34-903(+)
MFDFDEIEEAAERQGGWTEGAEDKAAQPSSAPAPVAASQERGTSSLAPSQEVAAGGGMFDFDDIEEKAMATCERPVQKNSAAAGGMFDFDEIEEQGMRELAAEVQQASPAAVTVDIAFNYRGHKWNQSFQVAKGSRVSELKQQIASDGPSQAHQIELLRFGRVLADTAVLEKAERLDFELRLPTDLVCDDVRHFAPEAPGALPQGQLGDLEVTVYIDRLTGLSTTLMIKKGSTVLDLKEELARQDASSASSPKDFELSVCGGSGRPLLESTVLVDAGLCQLELQPPVPR